MGSINVLFSDEVQSKFKTWTSQAGTKIQARLINADHSEVNLKTNKGKVIRLHPDKLCEADRDYVFSKFPMPELANRVIGKRLIFHAQDWPVTAVFQFNKNGQFGFGALKGNQIQTEREGLTYKIKDLEIKIMDGDKVFNRLKFINAKPKVGDSLFFGLSRTMVSGKIIGVADAAPF
tara:strand:- start:1313 stop:1843 length:531 start_codon:yes stop_codon:yes gene_type:complete